MKLILGLFFILFTISYGESSLLTPELSEQQRDSFIEASRVSGVYTGLIDIPIITDLNSKDDIIKIFMNHNNNPKNLKFIIKIDGTDHYKGESFCTFYNSLLVKYYVSRKQFTSKDRSGTLLGEGSHSVGWIGWNLYKITRFFVQYDPAHSDPYLDSNYESSKVDPASIFLSSGHFSSRVKGLKRLDSPIPSYKDLERDCQKI